MCLLARVGWEFYSAEDGGTSERSVSAAGSSKGLQKGPEQTQTVEKYRSTVAKRQVLRRYWRYTCKGRVKR
jgi:hypothetical protein